MAYLFYSIAVIVCSGLFLLLYKLLISRKAGYTFCRRYLIVTMLLAIVIPSMNVPLYHKAVRAEQPTPTTVTAANAREAAPEAANKTVPENMAMASEPQKAEENAAVPVATTVAAANKEVTYEAGFDKWNIAIISLYLIGVALCLAMIARSILFILRLRSKSELSYRKGYGLAQSKDVDSPFTFLGTIYIGSDYNAGELSQVLSHEASHVRHHHSLEKLAMSVLRSLFWFNPFLWMAEKRLEEVQEWQADNDALSDGYTIDEYRNTIVRLLFGINPLATPGLKSSFTKKRLLKMREKESTGHSLEALLMSVSLALVIFLSFGCTAVEERLANDDDREMIEAGRNSWCKTEGDYRNYIKKDDRIFIRIDDWLQVDGELSNTEWSFCDEGRDGFGDIKKGIEIARYANMESFPTMIAINGYGYAEFPTSKELKWINDKTIVIIGTKLATLDEFLRLKPEDYLAIVYYKPKRRDKAVYSLVCAITGESFEYTANYNYQAIIDRPEADLPEVKSSPGAYGVHGNYFIYQTDYSIATPDAHYAIDGRLVSIEEFKDVFHNGRHPVEGAEYFITDYNACIFRNSQAKRRFGDDVWEVVELRSRPSAHIHFSNVNGMIVPVINGTESKWEDLENLADVLGIPTEIPENDPLTIVEIFFDQTFHWMTDELIDMARQHIPWDDPRLIIDASRKVEEKGKYHAQNATRNRIIPVTQ